jgi:hypothetical protein
MQRGDMLCNAALGYDRHLFSFVIAVHLIFFASLFSACNSAWRSGVRRDSYSTSFCEDWVGERFSDKQGTWWGVEYSTHRTTSSRRARREA